jgi:hypothetical protein
MNFLKIEGPKLRDDDRNLGSILAFKLIIV